MPYEHEAPPSERPESEWRFIQELATAPCHQPLRWRRRKARAGEADLGCGVRLEISFPDPRGLLETAGADFAFFLRMAELRADGAYPVRVECADTAVREEFCLEVGHDQATLAAADTDGVRRGLIWIEDEMQRRGGPFLPLGVTGRRPWVRTRISRCFFGPVNRPPTLREELALDTDFYPDEYLNRLAHEGVNGLWLTVNWFTDIPSAIIPEYGREAGPRLERLRRTVSKCERYGIRIYAFCIEPAGFSRPYRELQAAAAAHPELVGHNRAFCITSAKGRAYVEEAVRTLCTEVPGLGGLLVISVGERQTHCASEGTGMAGCPRCRERDPADVLADTLAAMRQGLDASAPDAELISWPYGQFVNWNPARAVEAAARVPQGVCLQHNFESGGWNLQLGKRRPLWDYWQAVIGPTRMFRDCARAAARQGTRTFAKLQVACGHEVTTTQYVPVPGALYRKYAAMKKLGVSGAMLCWYPGAYPCVMTRAASEASLAPRAADEKAFLLDLARRDWGACATQVVKAWELCQKAYANFPSSHIFQYYGPMHDGVVWPLYLVPRRRPLSPFWQLHYPPSGDYIAECLSRHFTWAETLTLCGRLARTWARGAAIMKRLLPRFSHHPDRQRDIRVTVALGLQFQSGYDILRFYALRERLVEARAVRRCLAILDEMEGLVRQEASIGEELLPLAEAEPLLGFNSEAEGYKYWPDMIRWRMSQLRGLLRLEFPEVRRLARQGAPLFPAYTGRAPEGPVVSAPRVRRVGREDGRVAGPGWEKAAFATCGHWLRQVFDTERWRSCGYDGHHHLPAPDAAERGLATRWKACHDDRNLYVGVVSASGAGTGADAPFSGNTVQILVEPGRTQPRILFRAAPGECCCIEDDGYIGRDWEGRMPPAPWRITHCLQDRTWSFVLALPWRWLRQGAKRRPRALRLNVIRTAPAAPESGMLLGSWTDMRPVKGRLVWGYHNPATDLGWVTLA